MAAALCLLAPIVAISGAVAAPPPAPTYLTTLGNPGCTPGAPGCGLALTYSSGGDVDAQGNIYTADTGNGQVESFAPNGSERWRVGQELANKKSLGQFLNPRDLAYLNAPGFTGLNGAGLLFIADLGNNRVQVLNAYDGSASSLGSGWTTRFNSIIGISAGVDAQGAPVILTTDSVNAAVVREFTPGGTPVATVGTKCATAANTCGPSALLAPRDAATDAAGNVYVADYSNNRIVEFGARDLGTGIRAFGTRGTGTLQLNHPYGVAFDSAGHLYVADSDNGRIQEFNVSAAAPATPTYLATYGVKGSTSAPGQFSNLRRVAVTPGANPKVVGFDLWGNALDVFPAVASGTGTVSTFIGGQPGAGGAFNSPYGIAAGNGRLFVADTNNQRIQTWDSATDTFTSSFGQRGFGESDLGFNWPRSVAFASATNTVWVADTKNFRISEYTTAGVATGRTFGKSGQLNWPYDVAAYGTNVVVADTVNNRVQMWNPDTKTVLWSSDSLGIAMKQPRGLTVAPDPSNPGQTDVLIADSSDNRIVVLNADTGAFVRSIAPLINGAKAFHRIEGVAVDPRTGNIWVSDTSWNRILEVTPDGQTVKVKYGAEGSASNQFEYPSHLALVQDGSRMKLYVCDYWNNRVQAFDVTNL